MIGISFTCDANDCGNRIVKSVKRKTYETGTLLIQCSRCLKHHVMADHYGLYKDITGGAKNIEQIAKSIGQDVTRVDTSTFELEKLIGKFRDAALGFDADESHSLA